MHEWYDDFTHRLHKGSGGGSVLDAFGRLRVSDPQTLFDYQAQYDAGPLLWENVLTGSGTATHVANTASVALAVSGTSGDKVVRQSREYIRYQPGKSQLILLTFAMNAAKANLRQRVGYFDANDGIFLEVTGTTVNIVRRTSTSGSPVDTAIAKTNWSVDAFDGNGPSRVNIDLTKGNIFFIDMEWLGVGKVRTGFAAPSGELRVAHEFQNANALANVYTKTANLPVRYEVENIGATSGASTFSAICASVMSEGGFEFGRGTPFSANSGTTVKSVTTEVPVLSIRPKATFNSIVNRGSIILKEATGYVETTSARFNLVYGGTLTGASFASANASSIAEFDTAASAISGGILIDSFYLPGGAQIRTSATESIISRLPLTLDVAGSNPISLTITATRIGGNGTCSVLASLTWQELR